MEEKVIIQINGTDVEMDTSPVSYGVASGKEAEYIKSEKVSQLGLRQLSNPRKFKFFNLENVILIFFSVIFLFILIIVTDAIIDVVKAYRMGAHDAVAFRILFSMMPGTFFLIVALIFIVLITQKVKFIRLKKTYMMSKLPVAKVISIDSYKKDLPGYKIVVDNPDKVEGFLDYYCSPVLYSKHFQYLSEGDLVPVYVMKERPEVFYLDLEIAINNVKRIHNGETVKND